MSHTTNKKFVRQKKDKNTNKSLIYNPFPTFYILKRVKKLPKKEEKIHRNTINLNSTVILFAFYNKSNKWNSNSYNSINIKYSTRVTNFIVECYLYNIPLIFVFPVW